jgi:hypothetical protein
VVSTAHPPLRLENELLADFCFVAGKIPDKRLREQFTTIPKAFAMSPRVRMNIDTSRANVRSKGDQSGRSRQSEAGGVAIDSNLGKEQKDGSLARGGRK